MLFLVIRSPQRLVLLQLLLLSLRELGVARHGVHAGGGLTVQARAGLELAGGRAASLHSAGVGRAGTGAVPLGRLHLSLRVVFHLVVVKVAGPSERLATDVTLVRFLSFKNN